MAEKACHVFGSTTQVGLTQALGRMPNYSYVDAWSDYRRRVRWFWGVWLGGFMLAALLVLALSRTPIADAPIAEAAFIVIGAAWIAGFMIVAIRVQWFRCPRCHRQFFFSSFLYYNPYAGKCVHCGLPKGQT